MNDSPLRSTLNRLILTGVVVVLSADTAVASVGDDLGIWQSARTPELVALLLMIAAMYGAAVLVRRRGLPQMRPLAPLDAIGDAVGRSTETGTPVVYITGWGGDMARPTTMASMDILATVASHTAQHNCRLNVPTHDPLIASVAQDTVQQAATIVGKPEWAATTDVAFVTQSQFGYAAAVEGMMAREKPGAVFLLGTFEGEALLLAEGAYQCGAVTIAGTDSTIQLSFFLVACDYTLIGEELFAAAGLVSGNESIMAGVWAQDWLKYLILALLLSGVLLAATTDFNLAGLLSR
jgi:hypothetical protein